MKGKKVRFRMPKKSNKKVVTTSGGSGTSNKEMSLPMLNPKIKKTKGKTRTDKIVNAIIKNVEDEEIKYLLMTNNVENFDPFGIPNIQFVNGLVRGVAAQNRIGDYVRGKRLKIKGVIEWTPGANIGQTLARLMVVYYKQPNGLAIPFAAGSPAPSFIFYNQISGAPRPTQMYNIQDSDLSKFTILFDHTYKLINYAGALNNVLQPIDININLRDAVTCYKLGNTGGYGDIDKNSLWFVFWNDAESGMTLIYDQVMYYADD